VVEKGNQWHGRYYVDLKDRRKRVSVPLGAVEELTKTEAKQVLRKLLEREGINTAEHLMRAIRPVTTFAQESEWWKENKLSLFKPSCQETMGSHIDKYLSPRFGPLSVDEVDERKVQEFIADLNRTELAPKSIRNIVGVLKLILGKSRWNDWNLVLPEVPEKEQRYFTADEMRQIIDAATGQWKVLFATMACTGMRCGEVFGLHVEDLSLSAGQIKVQRSVWHGCEVTVKTKKGYRTVDIESALADMLHKHLNGRTTGRVFATKNGTPFSKDNVRRKLRTILQSIGLKPGGLHSFRHGRISLLQEKGVPSDLTLKWVGHSNLRTTSDYTHFNPEFRRRIAAEVGLLN
jgi:integrase